MAEDLEEDFDEGEDGGGGAGGRKAASIRAGGIGVFRRAADRLRGWMPGGGEMDIEARLDGLDERISLEHSEMGALLKRISMDARRGAEPSARADIPAEGPWMAGEGPWPPLPRGSEPFLAAWLEQARDADAAVALRSAALPYGCGALSLMDAAQAARLALAVARLESAPKEDVLRVGREVAEAVARKAEAVSWFDDGEEAAAGLLGGLPSDKAGEVLRRMKEADSVRASAIAAAAFGFEDLVRVDEVGIRILLRFLDKNVLALALKGASDAVKDLFFRNLSGRAERMLRNDIAAMGPVRLRDVADAQRRVAATAKDLAEQGEIVVSTSAGGGRVR